MSRPDLSLFDFRIPDIGLNTRHNIHKRFYNRKVWRYRTKSGKLIDVEKHFPFDLASIPRIIWPLLAPDELGRSGPLGHDWLYVHCGMPPNAPEVFPEPWVFTRKQADDLFLELMTIEGVSVWRRTVAYTAVRSFGWAIFYGFNKSITAGFRQWQDRKFAK